MKKYQIFVSSTYEDLRDERRAVVEAIIDIGHFPIGMEAFQASNEEQWSYITKRIDESDYYVVIVAERYGSIGKDGRSYTEMEYDYAREKGVPVAAFLLHEAARAGWRREKADSIDDRKSLDGFRSKCKGLMVKYWSDKNELSANCIKSLSQMFLSFPRDGWVPAKEAMRAEVANELARLSEENAALKEQIDLLRVSDGRDKELEDLNARLSARIVSLCEAKAKYKDGRVVESFEFLPRIISYPDALMLLLSKLLHGIYSARVAYTLCVEMLNEILVTEDQCVTDCNYKFIGFVEFWDEIVLQNIAEKREETIGETAHHKYYLSETGKRLVRYIRDSKL